MNKVSVDNDVVMTRMKTGETSPILTPAPWLDNSNRLTVTGMGSVVNKDYVDSVDSVDSVNKTISSPISALFLYTYPM